MTIVMHAESMQPDAIDAFLSKGHPLGDELGSWQQKMRSFGAQAPKVLIDFLRTAPPRKRPAAVYGLRAFGHEAWAEEFDDQAFYRLRAPGEEGWTIVRPTIIGP